MKQFLRKSLAHAVINLPRGPLIAAEHYELFQSAGLHVRPVDYYSPVPNTAEISPNLWDKPSEMIGVDRNLIGQADLLKELQPYLAEYYRLPETTNSSEKFGRAGFGSEDGAMLYSMIRKYKPGQIIEVGAGQSTLLSILALEVNGSLDARLRAIDPYPQPYLRNRSAPLVEIIPSKVENVSLEVFQELNGGDILFIDSSHSVRIGGDVIHEVIEMLPRLKPGVLIHIHDIFLPYHYPKDWVMNRHVCWTEQYLIQSFLAFNKAFEILWGYNMMLEPHREALAASFPGAPTFGNGGSLWLRKLSD